MADSEVLVCRHPAVVTLQQAPGNHNDKIITVIIRRIAGTWSPPL